jgi:hypothetical protein
MSFMRNFTFEQDLHADLRKQSKVDYAALCILGYLINWRDIHFAFSHGTTIIPRLHPSAGEFLSPPLGGAVYSSCI